MISLHLFRKVSATNVRYFKTRLPDLGKRIPGKRTLPPAEGTSMWDNDFTMQFWSKWNFWKPYKPPQLPGRLCPLPSGPIACNPARTLAGSLRAWEVLRNEQPIFQATSPQRTAPCYQLKKSYNVAATWSYIYICIRKVRGQGVNPPPKHKCCTGLYLTTVFRCKGAQQAMPNVFDFVWATLNILGIPMCPKMLAS